MATISFRPIGKKEVQKIYVRLSIDRKNNFRKSTKYTINTKDWSTKTNSLINSKDEKTKAKLDKLQKQLDNFKNELQEHYNTAISNKTQITSNWLEETIKIIQGSNTNNIDKLTNYFDYYINNLPTKQKDNNNGNISISTIQKYKTVQSKIKAFEEYTNKTYYVKDVNLRFRNEINNYLLNIELLSQNYTGRLIKSIKTICNDAKLNGIETHPQLDSVKGYTVKSEKIFLNFDELKQIEQTTFKRDALENAKDWLIIGCYVGQRVSDLLNITHKNIIIKNGIELIELTQKKTGKPVVIPINPKVREILNKRNGKFPYKISDTKFNEYIKEVARLSGINKQTKGAKIVIKTIQNKRTRRKEHGTFEKWELVTSHICRRSFSTNFYSTIPTPLLISVTGHSSEKQFLVYIGKTETDHAKQLAEYWSKQEQVERKRPHLTINRIAQ